MRLPRRCESQPLLPSLLEDLLDCGGGDDDGDGDGSELGVLGDLGALAGGHGDLVSTFLSAISAGDAAPAPAPTYGREERQPPLMRGASAAAAAAMRRDASLEELLGPSACGLAF